MSMLNVVPMGQQRWEEGRLQRQVLEQQLSELEAEERYVWQ